MYEYFLSAAESFIKYGMSPTALVVALVALFRTKRFKRFIGRRAPWLFKDDADVLNYQSRQIRIESKLDALMSAGGVTWDAHYLSGKKSQSVMDGQKNSLSKSLMARFRALFIGAFTHTTKGSYHSKIRGESIRMTKDILSGKKKFLAFIIAVLINGLNDVLGLNLSVNTLDAATYIGGGLIAVEGLLDIVRALQKKKPIEISQPQDDGGNHYS